MSGDKMDDYFKANDELSGFWGDFRGDKTLQNAIRVFAQTKDHTKPAVVNDFALNIMQRIIGKEFEKRRLLDLLELELQDIDLTEIPQQAVPTQSDIEENISIFDADKLDGFEFESFVAKILESNGFADVSVTRGSGDQGGDVLATREEEKLIIQAKRFSIDKKVTNSAVQEAIGATAWYNVNKGVVITNSIFTKSAKELAKRNNIELWDRKIVSEFIENHNKKNNPEIGKSENTDDPSESIEESEIIEDEITCPFCSYKNPEGSKNCEECENIL